MASIGAYVSSLQVQGESQLLQHQGDWSGLGQNEKNLMTSAKERISDLETVRPSL
jgi:hypothetical protein